MYLERMGDIQLYQMVGLADARFVLVFSQEAEYYFLADFQFHFQLLISL